MAGARDTSDSRVKLVHYSDVWQEYRLVFSVFSADDENRDIRMYLDFINVSSG